MRSAYAFAATVLILLPVTPALAQGFDGPYVGVQAGSDLTDVRSPGAGLGTFSLDDDRQSFAGGVYAGFDRRIASRIVVGGEAGIDIGADDAIESSNLGQLVRIDPDWSLDLTARAGYLLEPKTLAYVRGGYENLRLISSAASLSLRESASDNRDGWLVGAGVERQLTRHASARLEYRYSDLSDRGDGYDRNRLLAGITYRF